MSSEHSSSDLLSDDLQPTKSGIKTRYNATNGHISQIPGLSPAIHAPPEERVRGRRTGVLDSDSDYIKLAKQGGHKGLLWYEEPVISKPILYKAPDWFCPQSEDTGKPSGLITSEENKNPGALQPLEPPFGTDNMSAWERDNSSTVGGGDGREKNNDPDHLSPVEKLQTSNQHNETSKFKRIAFDKKQSPVDMSKLLSFGYAQENKAAQ